MKGLPSRKQWETNIQVQAEQPAPQSEIPLRERLLGEKLPSKDDPDFWSCSGFVKLFGVFIVIIGIAAGVFYAIEDYTEGLYLVIIVLLACILVVLTTRREPR